MKKSNMFTAMEQVLNEIESRIDRARENLDYEIKDYNAILEAQENDISEHTKEYHESSIETCQIAIHFWENAYNYIYENFQKIAKEYK